MLTPSTPVIKLEALRLCLRLLSRRGRAGEIVWRHGAFIQARRLAQHDKPDAFVGMTAVAERLAYYRRLLAHFESFKGEESKYRWLPVDVETFIDSKELLGYDELVYPVVMDALVEVNSGRYVEAVFTGGIGVGKSSAALLSQLYQLYLLLCLKKPQEEFGLDPASEILIVFQSITKAIAKEVDFGRFKALVENSPFFQTSGAPIKKLTDELEFENRIRVKALSGSPNAAIGQNVIGGMIEEIAFFAKVQKSTRAGSNGVFDQAQEVYSSIVRRRKSRFMNNGRLPGLLCVVSSRKYPGDFIDVKLREAVTDSSIFVYDKRIWDVKPWAFTKNTFQLFVGDGTRKPRFVDDGDVFSEEDRNLVVSIPDEYRTEFERDMLSALRDIAGVATQALHPFILATDRIAACFGQVQSVASRSDVDFVSTKLQVFPKRFYRPDEPRFAHIDLSLSSDSTGLSIGMVDRFVEVARDASWYEVLPVIRYDLVLEVRPPRNEEIVFSKVRSVLYTLRQLGLNIVWVSFDSFQSTDSMQILAQQGFSVGYTSMDADVMPYGVLKTAILDGRIQAPEQPKAVQELVRLEMDPSTGKIDHPAGESKDLADSMAGVAYGLTMRREIWARHNVPPQRFPRDLVVRADKQEQKDERSRSRHRGG